MQPGFAPAKVNLTLHVTGRRADGYHLLDSFVAFADVGDVVTAGPGDSLRITGPFAAGVPLGDTNLIRKALHRMGERRAVVLDKQLPHPAGIGGGSSDAAAILRLIGADPTTDDLLALGADVPVCMSARAARMQGIGERIAPMEMPPLAAVLVNPGLAVPTPAVFGALARADNPPMHDPVPWADAGAVIGWLAHCRNDLENPAMIVAPGIREVLDSLRASGANLSRMSGSGATCFGLYPSDAAARTAAAQLARPGWWVRACRLS